MSWNPTFENLLKIGKKLNTVPNIFKNTIFLGTFRKKVNDKPKRTANGQ